jgi:hypothetical protein
MNEPILSPLSWPNHVRRLFHDNLQLLFIGGVTDGYSMIWESDINKDRVVFTWTAKKDTQEFVFTHKEMRHNEF